MALVIRPCRRLADFGDEAVHRDTGVIALTCLVDGGDVAVGVRVSECGVVERIGGAVEFLAVCEVLVLACRAQSTLDVVCHVNRRVALDDWITEDHVRGGREADVLEGAGRGVNATAVVGQFSPVGTGLRRVGRHDH